MILYYSILILYYYYSTKIPKISGISAELQQINATGFDN